MSLLPSMNNLTLQQCYLALGPANVKYVLKSKLQFSSLSPRHFILFFSSFIFSERIWFQVKFYCFSEMYSYSLLHKIFIKSV